MDRISPVTSQPSDTQQPDNTNKPGSLRAPKCTRCRNHGMISDLRGHKHKCYWRDCTCRKCLISSDRQRATADRIALFRQQVRQAVQQDQKRRYSQISNDEAVHESFDKMDKKMTTKIDVNMSSAETQIKIQQGNRSPPPLTKLSSPLAETTTYSTSYSPHYATTTPKTYWNPAIHEEEIQRKNIEILKYIFPFYDTGVLNIISRGCHNDMLQTVLSISSCVLESRKHHYPPSKESTEKRLLDSPTSNPCIGSLKDGSRCCSSPYCPVNSYLHLRKNSPVFSHYTPPLTAHFDYKGESTEKLSPVVDDCSVAIPTKKFRFSFDDDLKKTSPFCETCKKYGMHGDKFCPLCGILYQ